VPNPFYRGEVCGAREMEDIDRRRYNAVREAGWLFDHDARVWVHLPTGRTGLNQHVIYECLRNHDAMPPCGLTRAGTPWADRRQWIERGDRLRQIEARTGRLAPQHGCLPRSTEPTDQRADAASTDPVIRHANRDTRADAA
jgi:hypothetical protein